uniref:Putative secreted protein n=1 Tax=Anopheles darlingi TaxID=43151 RepID=A0A2M4DJH2_ANODA
MNFRFISFIHAHFIPLFWASDRQCPGHCTGVIVHAECATRMLFAELIGSRSVRCHVTIIKLMIANDGIRTVGWWFFPTRTEHRTVRFAHLKISRGRLTIRTAHVRNNMKRI